MQSKQELRYFCFWVFFFRDHKLLIRVALNFVNSAVGDGCSKTVKALFFFCRIQYVKVHGASSRSGAHCVCSYWQFCGAVVAMGRIFLK